MFRLFLVLVFALALLSCGTKGPLTLPKPATAAPVPAPTTAKDSSKDAAEKPQ